MNILAEGGAILAAITVLLRLIFPAVGLQTPDHVPRRRTTQRQASRLLFFTSVARCRWIVPAARPARRPHRAVDPGEGKLLGIYPEWHPVAWDGRLYRARQVARMALEADVPVILVARIDTEKIQPRQAVPQDHAWVGISVGKPLDFSRYEGMENDRFVLRSMTDEICCTSLWEESGQRYVDPRLPRQRNSPSS